jgi:hypothetical protein
MNWCNHFEKRDEYWIFIPTFKYADGWNFCPICGAQRPMTASEPDLRTEEGRNEFLRKKREYEEATKNVRVGEYDKAEAGQEERRCGNCKFRDCAFYDTPCAKCHKSEPDIVDNWQPRAVKTEEKQPENR